MIKTEDRLSTSTGRGYRIRGYHIRRNPPIAVKRNDAKLQMLEKRLSMLEEEGRRDNIPPGIFRD